MIINEYSKENACTQISDRIYIIINIDQSGNTCKTSVGVVTTPIRFLIITSHHFGQKLSI